MELTKTIPAIPVEEGAPLKKRSLPLLDRVLREQQALTAVERFAQLHADASTPLLEPYYRQLLPATPPGPGQQYAFSVDLDRCTGCKACVAACHNLNGLDSGETWRSVGVIHGGTPLAPLQKTVTTACHHCVDPACMNGCPVKAYEKDPVTGIVRHLDDQCIGCKYCMFTCPYEVPQFNSQKGIVRKCDMCSGRLAQGEAPACVQACPNGAIAIEVVDTVKVLEDAQSDAFLPGAPSPGITAPSTQYKTQEALPRNALPADFYSLRPADAHMPLVAMLVLTQLAAGAFALDRLLGRALEPAIVAEFRPFLTAAALLLGMLGLGAATLHLGRPQYMFRALLGLRTSWMSREVFAFNLFFAFATPYALSVSPLRTYLPEPAATLLANSANLLGWLATLAGALSIACSVMLYVVTQRAWWNSGRTSFVFAGSAILLGTATALVAMLASQADAPAAHAMVETLLVAVGALTLIKVGGELSALARLGDKRHAELKRSALLLVSQLWQLLKWRLMCAALGGIAAPILCYLAVTSGASAQAIAWAVLGWLLLCTGELLERYTFFAAMSAPRMPGGFR